MASGANAIEISLPPSASEAGSIIGLDSEDEAERSQSDVTRDHASRQSPPLNETSLNQGSTRMRPIITHNESNNSRTLITRTNRSQSDRLNLSNSSYGIGTLFEDWEADRLREPTETENSSSKSEYEERERLELRNLRSRLREQPINAPFGTTRTGTYFKP